MTEAYLTDPSGLLTRAPELEAVARADGAIARALERGDAHAVYRALWWARFRGRLPAHRAVVEQLLSHRRLFVSPVKGTPTLATLNGIGGSLYGRTEVDPDGSYIATHFAVIFFIPVFPAAQYLVADAQGEGGKKAWYFLGRVPMSVPIRFWNRLVVACVLLGVGGGALQALYSSGHHDVHFVNGLAQPTHIRAGAREIDVPPRGRQAVSLPTGSQEVHVTVGGKEVEAGRLEVKAGSDVQIWNVLGAAPVARETVFYSAKNAKPPDTPPQLHCAETNIVMPNADYVFTDPPSTLSMPETQSISSRQAVSVLPGDLTWCLSAFAAPGKAKAAAALAKGLVVGDSSIESLGLAVTVLRIAGEPGEGLPLLKEALGRSPDSVDLHRLFQSVAKEAGEDGGLLEEYRARRDANPDSPDAAYLYARLFPARTVLPEVRTLLARFPDHLAINRLAAFGLLRNMEFGEAVRVLEKIRSLDPGEWMGFVEEHVTALAAQGRVAEAEKLSAEAFPAARGEQKLRLAAFAAWLEGSAAPGEALLSKSPDQTPDKRMQWRLRFWTASGDQAIPAGSLPRLLYLAHFQPQEALTLLGPMRPEDVSELAPEVLVLLEGEAVRASSGPATAKLENTLRYLALPSEKIRAYLTEGSWSDEVEELPLYLQAALHAARARGPLPPAEKKRLRDLALRFDPIGGFARKALDTWPAV